MGDLSFSNSKKNFRKCPCFPEIDLFSQEDLPILKFKSWPISWETYLFQIQKRTPANVHASLKLVCFHRQPVHFEIQKFAYFHERHVRFKLKKKELPEIGLFSRAICLFQIPKRTLTSVHASLKFINFHRRLAHFEIQKVVYFHGQPTIFKFQKEL